MGEIVQSAMPSNSVAKRTQKPAVWDVSAGISGKPRAPLQHPLTARSSPCNRKLTRSNEQASNIIFTRPYLTLRAKTARELTGLNATADSVLQRQPWEAREDRKATMSHRLGGKWKQQLMSNDPFISSVCSTNTPEPQPPSQSRRTRTDTSPQVQHSGHPTLLNTTRGQGQGLRRQLTKDTKREDAFVLREHVNERGIPNYDAIRDEHATWCESRDFQDHVHLTRSLTPEHEHILEARISHREDVQAAVGTPAGAAMPSQPSASNTQQPLLEGTRVDWAMTPLMEAHSSSIPTQSAKLSV